MGRWGGNHSGGRERVEDEDQCGRTVECTERMSFLWVNMRKRNIYFCVVLFMVVGAVGSVEWTCPIAGSTLGGNTESSGGNVAPPVNNATANNTSTNATVNSTRTGGTRHGGGATANNTSTNATVNSTKTGGKQHGGSGGNGRLNGAETEGVFQRTYDCAMVSSVSLTGDLNITGRSNLTELSAPANARHFSVNSGAILTLAYLKLVGGNVAKSGGGRRRRLLGSTATTGGSIFLEMGLLHTKSCWFYNNKATYGGAVGSNTDNAVTNNFVQNTVLLEDTNFTDNEATDGGAVYTFGSLAVRSKFASITWNGGTCAKNVASGSGGCIYVRGNTAAVIRGTTIKKNVVKGNGGGIICTSDSVNDPICKLYDTDVIENEALYPGGQGAPDGYGGGFYQENGEFYMEGGVVKGNVCTEYGGGGVLDVSIPATIKNVIFEANTCNDADNGHGFYAKGGEARFVFSTFRNHYKETHAKNSTVFAASAVLFLNTNFEGVDSVHTELNELVTCAASTCKEIGGFPAEGYGCTNKENHQGVTCSKCTAGSYREEGSGAANCYQCSPGQFQDDQGARSCKVCGPGMYQGYEGKTSCRACATGKYGNNSFTCFSFPPGFYSQDCLNATLGLGCAGAKQCPKGWYCPGSLLDEEFRSYQCDAGTYANSEMSAECSICETGKYTDAIGAVECQSCVEGQYQAERGSTSCVSCAKGTFADTRGTTQCSQCDSGRYQDEGGRLKCKVCAQGKYQDSKESTECKNCPIDTFSSVQGTVAASGCYACTAIPAWNKDKGIVEGGKALFTTTNGATGATARSDCVCKEGYYDNPQHVGMVLSEISSLPEESKEAFFENTHLNFCSLCPKGARCSVDMNTTTLDTQEDFWRYNSSSNEFHPCLYESIHCKGTANKTSAVDVFGSDAQCQAGHSGALCASCLPGYKLVMQRCTKCNSNGSVVYVAFAILNIFVCVALVLFFLRSAKKANTERDENKVAEDRKQTAATRVSDNLTMSGMTMGTGSGGSMTQRAPTSLEDHQKQVSGTVKILVGYLQILTSFNMTLGVQWPSNFASFLNFFQFINIDFMGVFSNDLSICDFVLPYFEQMLVYIMILPVFVVMAFVARSIAMAVNKDGAATYTRCAMKAIFTVMFILYPSIGNKITRIFKCHKVGHRYFLEADMAIECYTGQHATLMIPLAWLFMGLFIFGIPLYTLNTLRRNLAYLHDTTHEKHEELKDELGTLYLQYEKQFWFWELIEMLKKIFFTGLLVVLGNEFAFTIVVAILVQFTYILIVERYEPYGTVRDDLVQLISSIQLFLTLFAALILKLQANNDSLNDTDSQVLGIVLILLNSSTFVMVAASLFLATEKGRKCLGRCVPAKRNDTTKVRPTKNVDPVETLRLVREQFGAGSKEYANALKAMTASGDENEK